MKVKINYKTVIISVLAASLFLFTNLDKKICEMFLANRKINVDVENVILVKGISSAESEFASAREKIAESVLMLNEFGADKIVFDFDLSKKSSDNLFFDADSYLDNCLKTRNNIITSAEISKGAGLPFDYKQLTQIDEPVIDSVREKLDESNAISCDIFFEIKLKENTLVKVISELEDEGYFEYTPDYNSPFAASVDFIRKKEILFDNLDGSSFEKKKAFEEYAESKQHFIDCVSMYLEGPAKELLNENADERKNDYGNIEESFSNLQKSFTGYFTERDSIKTKVENACCVFAPDDTVYNLAAVLFCFKSFVKTIWWWAGILLAVFFCIGCDVLCSFVSSLEKKVCICITFIYLSILISFIVFYTTGIYIGTIVCLISCILMTVFEILQAKYGNAYAEFKKYINGGESKAKGKGKKKASENSLVATKKSSILVCSIEHYAEIAGEFETEKDSLVLFNRYYDLIVKTVENFGGKEKSRENGVITFIFKLGEDNDVSVDACKSALKIKSVISKLNAKLIKEEILGKEISIAISVALVV